MLFAALVVVCSLMCWLFLSVKFPNLCHNFLSFPSSFERTILIYLSSDADSSHSESADNTESIIMGTHSNFESKSRSS